MARQVTDTLDFIPSVKIIAWLLFTSEVAGFFHYELIQSLSKGVWELRKIVNILFIILTRWHLPSAGCYSSFFLTIQRQLIVGFFFYLYLFIHCMHVIAWEWRSETTYKGKFFPSIRWVLGVGLRLLGLKVSTFTAKPSCHSSSRFTSKIFVLCDMRLSCLSFISDYCFSLLCWL